MNLSFALELLATLALSSYFAILTFSFFKFRLERKKEELNMLANRLELQDLTAGMNQRFDKEFSKQDYILPLIFVTVLTFLGLFLLMLSPVLYEVAPGEPVRSPLWSGSGFWEGSVFETEKRTLAIVAWALLGGFVNGAQYIYRRFSTVDLTPGNFYSVGIRMLLATVVSVLLSHFISPDFGMPKHMILVVAFLTGMFPERGFKLLLSKVESVFPDKDALAIPNMPLQSIEGVSYFHQIRLKEIGIDNVQNLANFDFLLLTIKTPFPVRLLVDWVSQAKLIVEFREQTIELQKAGIRSALDYLEAFDGYEDRFKTVSEVTGITPIKLEVNLKNLEKDRSLALLAQFKESLFHLKVRN